MTYSTLHDSMRWTGSLLSYSHTLHVETFVAHLTILDSQFVACTCYVKFRRNSFL
jgi:hypothetical protein